MSTGPADLGLTGDASSVDLGVECWQAEAVPDPTDAAFDDADGAEGDFPDPSVSATCTSDTVTIASNGIPTWEYIAITPNGLGAKTHTWRIPRVPTRASAPGGVPMGGAVGITVTGLPIFGPTEAPMDGYRDPVIDTLLDACGGHTAPPMGSGTYHMHGGPSCLVAQLGGARWGLIVGFAFDGYPILANTLCEDATCATTSTAASSWRLVGGSYDDAASSAWGAHEYVSGLGDLDVCNGLTIDDPALPFDYAYVATDTFPYYLGCYRGVPDTSNFANAPTSDAFYDYPDAL